MNDRSAKGTTRRLNNHHKKVNSTKYLNGFWMHKGFDKFTWYGWMCPLSLPPPSISLSLYASLCVCHGLFGDVCHMKSEMIVVIKYAAFINRRKRYRKYITDPCELCLCDWVLRFFFLSYLFCASQSAKKQHMAVEPRSLALTVHHRDDIDDDVNKHIELTTHRYLEFLNLFIVHLVMLHVHIKGNCLLNFNALFLLFGVAYTS